MPDAPPPPLSYAAPPLAGVVPVPEAVSPADVPRQLAAAELAWRPVRRAVRYATFDAWTLAACAALSIPCVGIDASGVVVAVLLGGVAVVELRSVRRLRRLDPEAPRALAINQLGLGGVILLYSAWNLYLTRSDRGLMAVLMAQGLSQAGPETVALARQIVYTLYVALAVVGPLTTASTGWFYATRTARLRAYVAETPTWIVQMQRDRGQL